MLITLFDNFNNVSMMMILMMNRKCNQCITCDDVYAWNTISTKLKTSILFCVRLGGTFFSTPITGGTIEGPPETPRTISALWYGGYKGALIMPRDARLSSLAVSGLN